MKKGSTNSSLATSRENSTRKYHETLDTKNIYEKVRT